MTTQNNNQTEDYDFLADDLFTGVDERIKADKFRRHFPDMEQDQMGADISEFGLVYALRRAGL